MAFVDNYQYRTAVDIVKTAIESGSIKLLGTGARVNAELHATADATYLITLLTQLTEQLPEAE